MTNPNIKAPTRTRMGGGQSTALRRMIHGPIQPMEKPNWFVRLRNRIRSKRLGR